MIKQYKIYLNCYRFLFIFSIIINFLFLYNIILFDNIENLFRTILLTISILITIFFNLYLYLTKNKKHFTIIYIILIIYIIILIIISYNLKSIYIKINKISINKTLYSSSIVTLKDNYNEDIMNIDKIGIISNKKYIDGYIIPLEIIDNNNLDVELVYYSDYISMINDLLNKKIEYIFLPTNYKTRFDDINVDKLKIIYSQRKEIKYEIDNKKDLESFTILLMGVDSTDNNIDNSFYNGDALILITFNPKKNTSTMLSIPRDTYLNISCMNDRRNKITHSAWFDDDCIISTINNSFNININYYIKINFKGLVNLVDNLGGIVVDVPYSFCESNSNRLWGMNTIYVEKGIQQLDGEQALAFARNRHPWPEFCGDKWTNYYSNDIIRGENQKKVIKSIVEKVKTIKSFESFRQILDTISENILTNINTNNILSFYKMGKNINNINIQKLFLNGYDEYIYDYDFINNTGTNLTLYNYIPYKESIDELSKVMNDNLDGKLIITNETIGDLEGTKYIDIMPSFIGKTYYEAQEFCDQHNIKLIINYVSGTDIGYITNQSINELTDLDYVDTLTIDVVNNIELEKEISKIDTSNNSSNNKIEKNTGENNINYDLDPIIKEIFN